MNITVGASILIIYGTFIVLYFIINRRQGGRVYKAAHINAIVCYALCLAAFALLPKFEGERSLNFVPFVNFLKNAEQGRVFEITHFLEYVLDAALGILLFVPLGILTGIRCELDYVKRPFLRAFLLGAALSVCIGFLRWLLPFNRAVDIDCVIYNALGALTGVFIFGLVRRKAFMRKVLKMLRLSSDVDQILS